MLDVLDLVLRNAVGARHGERVAVHAAGVGLGAHVPGVEGRAQRFQRRPVRILKLPERQGQVPRCFLHAAIQQGLVLPPLDEELAALHGALGRDEQLVHVDRFDDEVVRAYLEALDGRLDVPDARQHDDRGVGVELPGQLQELEPVHDRHLHVRHGQRRPRGAEDFEALAPVIGELTLVAVGEEDLVQHLAHLAIVVHDQHVLPVVRHGQYTLSRDWVAFGSAGAS